MKYEHDPINTRVDTGHWTKLERKTIHLPDKVKK